MKVGVQSFDIAMRTSVVPAWITPVAFSTGSLRPATKLAGAPLHAQNWGLHDRAEHTRPKKDARLAAAALRAQPATQAAGGSDYVSIAGTHGHLVLDLTVQWTAE